MSKRDRNPSRGPNQRQLRVGELIRRTIADVFARGDLFDPDLDGVSITVGEVRMSTDLKLATVYVLPLGGQEVEKVTEALNRSKGELRHAVTKSVALKFSPDLKFVEDTTFAQMDATTRMLSEDRVRRDVDAGDEE